MEPTTFASDRPAPKLAEALSMLRAYEPELRLAGVLHASIFGSVARAEAVAGSDLDIIVELDPSAHVSMFELMGIELRLREMFQMKVDVVSKRGLRPLLDDSILADAVEAF